MTSDPRALSRFLRQIAELGGPDLYLEERTADELREVLAANRGVLHPKSEPSRMVPAQPRPPIGVRASESATVQPPPPAPSASAVAAPVVPVPAAPTTATLRTLEGLSEVAATCVLCRLHEKRTRVVFGEGHANADVVVVGEAPGQDEDRTGRPFVGRAGKLLDLLLLTAGFPRENVYICNVLKCRPPQNRNPYPDEMELCTSHYLHGQLAAIAPRVILTVGRFAVQALLETDTAIGRLRGRIHTYRGTPTIVSYHPAYLLRSPKMVAAAWEDLQLLRTVVDEQT